MVQRRHWSPASLGPGDGETGSHGAGKGRSLQFGWWGNSAYSIVGLCNDASMCPHRCELTKICLHSSAVVIDQVPHLVKEGSFIRHKQDWANMQIRGNDSS